MTKLKTKNLKLKTVMMIFSVTGVLITPSLVWADSLVTGITKSRDNQLVITWKCSVGANYKITGTNSINKSGQCQSMVGVGDNTNSLSIPYATEPFKITIEVTKDGQSQTDTVEVNFETGKDEPTLTRSGGGETAGGLLQVTSPDFGGPFTNIGDYVVKVIQKILPIFMAGAVLVIVWAGIRSITSQGSPDATSQAKSLLEGAILGLLTLFLVGVLLSFLT